MSGESTQATDLPTSQTIADLRACLEALRTHGWTQGKPRNAAGCLCLLGAVSFAVTGHADPNAGPITQWMGERVRQCQVRLAEVLGLGGDLWWAVSRWNDTRGRTREEVIALVESTIARLEAVANV